MENIENIKLYLSNFLIFTVGNYQLNKLNIHFRISKLLIVLFLLLYIIIIVIVIVIA